MTQQIRMYQYRIYPSNKQKNRLIESLKSCKEVYNDLLSFNKEQWTKKYDFNDIILDLKICNPELLKKVHSQVLQNVSDRLSKSFDNFFRRVKEKKNGKNIKAGYPRFKSKIYSMTYPQSGFKIKTNKRIHLSKIGNVPIVLHRIPKGKIKTLTIKQNNAGQWYVIFSCEQEEIKVKHKSKEVVGIDVGLETFATLTDNKNIDNPRWFRKSEQRLKILQRRLSRKVKGSNNRKKAMIKVAKCHLYVFNQRNDFLHKISYNLTEKYCFIGVEKLNINNMLKNHCLAKSISDASWGKFISYLSYKAVKCGGQVVKNNKTKGSSHRCSQCGFYVKDMSLSKRIFECPSCKYIEHRDLNAANNHLKDTIGQMGINTPVDILPLSSINGKVSRMVEAGTIYNGI